MKGLKPLLLPRSLETRRKNFLQEHGLPWRVQSHDRDGDRGTKAAAPTSIK